MEKQLSVKYVIDELNKNKYIFKNLMSNLPKEVYIWRSDPQKWCLLEIVCHLYDEEREDFRARVKHMIENPEQAFPTIDPADWVIARKYIEKDYETILSEFVEEREISAKWLSRLNSPLWYNISHHPKLGDISANKFFINWLAHDYLHIRQIIKLKYDYLKSVSNDDLTYAGNW